MSFLDDARYELDRRIAAYQADIGRFLTLKDRIYKLPEADRLRLLPEQQAIESEAVDLTSKAADLKNRAQAMNALDFAAVGQLSKEALGLAEQATALVERGKRQQAQVEEAEGKAPAAKQAGVSPLLMLGGAAALYALYKGRSRA